LLSLFIGFLFSEATVSWVVFINCFSVCSLMIYRKDSDFYWLFYPATLLKVFEYFLVQFFGSFRYKIVSFANRDKLTSSFLIWISFISSSYLIALAGNSKTMLNGESVERTHPCLIAHFRGNGYSFSLPNMLLAIGVLISLYYVEVNSSYI
jgi:hypothetical protein